MTQRPNTTGGRFVAPWQLILSVAVVASVVTLLNPVVLLGGERLAGGQSFPADPASCMACLRAFDIVACHEAAFELETRGRVHDAIALETMIHERSPNNPEFSTALGRMYYRVHNTPRAIEMYHTALSVSSGYPPALVGLGAVMQDQGETEIAVRYFGRAARENPDVPLYKIRLAEALVQGGREQDAQPVLMEIVERWPDSSEAGSAQRMMSRTALAKP